MKHPPMGGLCASFLLPARDAARTLSRAVHCLLDQDEPRHEVIVADDGSVDDTAALASSLAERYPRVRLVRGPRRSIAAALNLAFAAARAPIVVRMDADDTCAPERLRLLLETFAARPELDVVGSRVVMVPPELVGVGIRRYLAWQNGLMTHDEMARERFVESPVTHATCAFRSAALRRVGGWRETLVPEDIDLWLRLFAAGARFGKREEVLYDWHEHEERATHRDPRFSRGAILACKAEGLTRLLDGRPAAVWGTGEAPETWRRALGDAGALLVDGGRLDPRALRRPGARFPWRERGDEVLILPFLSSRVRADLRQRLDDDGEEELRTYVFVT